MFPYLLRKPQGGLLPSLGVTERRKRDSLGQVGRSSGWPSLWQGGGSEGAAGPGMLPQGELCWGLGSEFCRDHGRPWGSRPPPALESMCELAPSAVGMLPG